MAEAPDSVLEQIQKLLKLASKSTNEHEAALAAAKAQELLTKWNLTHEAVSGSNVGSGARQKAAVEGGFHQYERDLWEAVADLNFCLYWHDRYYNHKGERNKYNEVRTWMYQHSLVGRKVNVAATQAMASYLVQECTRLTKERTRGENSKYSLSHWANSYRRGIVARVCEKLRVERNSALAAEETRRAQELREASGASTSTAVSLSVYIDSETDANIDFEWGEGTAARWAAEKAEKAAKARQHQEAYTKWAAEHPEEARKAEEKRERQLRQKRRSSASDNIDSSAFWSGYDDGASVSINRQAGNEVQRRIGR